MTSSSSAASAFLTGAGGGGIRTDIMATATHTDTAMVMVTPTGTVIITGIITATPVTDMATAIKGTATMVEETAMALDLGSRSYRGASRGLATIMAPLMESWDHKPGAPFGPTNVRMTN